jgi:hypothetical protein
VNRGAVVVALTLLLAVPMVARAPVLSARAERSVGATCRETKGRPRSAPAIVRRVCTEVPALARLRARASNLRATDLIRQWAFRQVDARSRGWVVAPDGSRRWLPLPEDAWQMSAMGYLRVFDADRHGAACGDAAWFLLRVYEAFGLESYIYNYGLDGTGATHVLTLVRVGSELVAQDAYFDQSIRDASGARIAFVDVIARLRSGRHDSLRFVAERPFPTRDVLLAEDVFDGIRDDLGVPGTSTSGVHDCEHRGGFWHCRDSLYTYASAHLREPAFDTVGMSTLAADGWPANLDYLMLYPIGVTSETDGWTPFERIAETTPTAELLRDIYDAIAPGD